MRRATPFKTLRVSSLFQMAAIVLLSLADPTRAADQPFDVLVTSESTPIMVGEKSIGEVPKGIRLTIVQTNGNWYLIDVPNANPPRQGWIRKINVLSIPAAPVATPRKSAPHTPEELAAKQRHDRRDERNRYSEMAEQLFNARKYDEAIAATEKMLAIEREDLGDNDPEALASRGQLATLHRAKGDFAGARKLSEELLATCTKLFGNDDWRVTDARLAIERTALVEKLDPSQRLEFAEGDQLASKVVALHRQGKYAEAADAARRAAVIQRKFLGEKHPEYAVNMANLGVMYLRMGDYARAEPLLRQSLEIYKHTLGEKHPGYANGLEALGVLYKAKGDYSRAETLFRQAVEITKQAKGEKHRDFAAALDNLGSLYLTMGDFARAEPFYRQALEIRKEALGENDAQYAESLNELASLYQDKGDYARAEPLFRQALEATRQALGEKHPDYATSLNNLAAMYVYTGQYDRAEPLYHQALELIKQRLGENHPDYARSLNNLALMYKIMCDYARAEPLYRQATEIRKQALGERHPAYAASLNNLAVLYNDMGDFARAEPLYRQAMEIRKQALGAKHPEYAQSLTNLASLYEDLGDYARAEPLCREALEITKQALGEKHPDYATSLNNLATLYIAMGDDVRAEPLLRQALEVARQALGEKHPEYAQSLNSLAALYMDMGDYARAEPLYRQALEIDRQAFGEKHPAYAHQLNDLASLYQHTGDYVRAEPLFRQALEIRKQVLGDKHPDYATSLNNLALLYTDMGDYARAEPLYRQALEIYKQAVGENHPDYATNLSNLALIFIRMKKPREAVEPAAKSVDIIRRLLDATADVQSERQQLAMNALMRFYLDCLLTATADAHSPAEIVYPAVFAWKGAVTARQQAIQRMRQATRGQVDPPTADLYRQLSGKTAELANMSQAVPSPAQAEMFRGQLAAIHDEVELLQQKLAAASASYRHELEQRRRSPDDLRQSLPADTVLVDLIEYRHYSAPAEKGHLLSHRVSLVAFVVRRDAPVERIELGPAEPIGQAIAVWRWRNIGHPRMKVDEKKSIEATLAAWRQTQQDADPGVKLREWVWDKVQPHLNGAKTVLLSPDGATALFPWSALPGKEPGSYMIEDFSVAVAPIPRLLAENNAPSRDSEETAKPSLLLVGDVDFDAEPSKAPSALLANSTPRGIPGGEPVHWNRLNGTRTEIVTIADSFRRRFQGAEESELRDAGATKDAVATEMAQHRYVHLATHGFFAPGASASARSAAEDRGNGPEMITRQSMTALQPELLSGLVLAGANHAPSEGRDTGILTALEVAQLDLGKVELATLSACETGLGDAAGGEGVLGLQRAFQVAGAKTVVATLWTIDDDASRSLMVDFYDNLWKKKLPKLEALRQAQLTMLREGIKRGLKLDDDQPPDKDRRLPPYYWAAFELSGDWR